MARLADACVLSIKNGSNGTPMHCVLSCSPSWVVCSGAQIPKKDVPELDPDIRSCSRKLLFSGNSTTISVI